MHLAGKAALVTGSAKRVGREIALALARRGASIAVHYRASRDEAERTAAEIRSLGAKAVVVRAELTRDAEVKAMVDTVADELGGVDVLVNNAAVFFRTPFATVTEADWDRTVGPNLKGPFLCCVHAGRRMLAQPGGGAIVNIADWAGMRPYMDYLPYCVSKAGVIALTQGLARTLAPKVRVNAVGPGPVLVPSDLPKDEADEIAAKTPLKRHGSPADVAAAVLFLLEGSDFVTGAFLPVDGGRLIA